MTIRKVAWKNLVSNPFNTILSLLLMTFGVGIISLILLLNNQIEQQFQNNIRGVDMVIGAKGSPLQLILASLYHVDNPTGNISYQEANKLTKHPLVDFTIPLSYGDSYNGFRIVGTTHEYINLYNANLDKGKLWKKSMEVVIGSEVAEFNSLDIGDTFYGTHGLNGDGHIHDDKDYQVVGILNRTNTTIDKLITTDLASVWEVHDHDHDDDCSHDHDHKHDNECKHDLDISAELMITSMLVKFKNPAGFIQLPRTVNETTSLQAAMPVFEINRLTNLIGFGAQTINFIALIIMMVSGLSIFISLYNSLKKRRYELALMRVHGATKLQLIKLVLLEGLFLSFVGTIFGLLISRLSLFLISLFITQSQSINNIDLVLISDELWLFLTALCIGFFASLAPSFLTYRMNIPKILSNA